MHQTGVSIGNYMPKSQWALAILMISFSVASAGGARSDSELLRSIRMGDIGLYPVPFSEGVAVVEPYSEKEFFGTTRVSGESLVGQRHCITGLTKAGIVGVDVVFSRPDRPFSRIAGNFSDRNNIWFTNFQSNVKSRSFPCVVNTKFDSELFPNAGFPVCPLGVIILSSLDGVSSVSQPSPLIQTHRIFGYSECFLGLVNLLPGVPSVEECQYYKRDGRTGHNPIWIWILGLIFGLTLQIAGGYLVFFRFCQFGPSLWRELVLGIFLIAVGGILLNFVMPHIDPVLSNRNGYPPLY